MTTDEQLLDVRHDFRQRLIDATEDGDLSIDELDAGQQRLLEIMNSYYAGNVDADMAADAIEKLEADIFS